MNAISESPAPLVTIIDDDPSVGRGLSRILKTSGYRVECYETASQFLDCGRHPNCLLLDLNLPDMSGLDLQNELVRGDLRTPIIFISGLGDIPTSVKAMKSGALDFLEKPFDSEDLLKAVHEAIEMDQRARTKDDRFNQIRSRVHLLTPREFEVLTFVITGVPNKAIADELNASEKTIKVHRGRVMTKLGATSIVELVRLADKAGVKPALVTI